MNFGSGLSKIGIAPGQETFLGVYLSNCVEVKIMIRNYYHPPLVGTN